MKISNIFSRILASLEDYGYSRAANELLRMSDEQLVSLGLSRKKIIQGRAGLPWTLEQATVSVVSASIHPAPAANQDHFHHQTAA